MQTRVHLTFDQDWAPPCATRKVAARLSDAGLEATFFVTHDCPSLAELRHRTAIELGWHPNFLPGSSHGITQAEVLDTMARLVPDARGVRAHGLMRSTPLLLEYGRRGLLYEASDLMDGMAGLRPLVAWNRVVRIPIYWVDDVHLTHRRACRLSEIDLASPGLKVFCFHPVLVDLNAVDLEGYRRLKGELSAKGLSLMDATDDDLAPYRRLRRPGIGDLFGELVDHLVLSRQLQGTRLAGVAAEVLDA